jgi:hypothetical protein
MSNKNYLAYYNPGLYSQLNKKEDTLDDIINYTNKCIEDEEDIDLDKIHNYFKNKLEEICEYNK